MAVAFLMTQVRDPDEDDWKKLCWMIQYLLLGIEDLFHCYFSCFCVNASVTCSDVHGAYILIAL